MPRGQGVGAVALMEDDEVRSVIGIAQIIIEGGELRREEQTFVDNRLTRTGDDIGGEGESARVTIKAFAGEEESAFNFFGGEFGALDDGLDDEGLSLAGVSAESTGIVRHVAPGDEMQP